MHGFFVNVWYSEDGSAKSCSANALEEKAAPNTGKTARHEDRAGSSAGTESSTAGDTVGDDERPVRGGDGIPPSNTPPPSQKYTHYKGGGFLSSFAENGLTNVADRLDSTAARMANGDDSAAVRMANGDDSAAARMANGYVEASKNIANGMTNAADRLDSSAAVRRMANGQESAAARMANGHVEVSVNIRNGMTEASVNIRNGMVAVGACLVVFSWLGRRS
jgi:hypothetical protein